MTSNDQVPSDLQRSHMKALLNKEVAGHLICTVSTHLSPDHQSLNFNHFLVLNQNKLKDFVRKVRPAQIPRRTGSHTMLYPSWQY